MFSSASEHVTFGRLEPGFRFPVAEEKHWAPDGRDAVFGKAG